MQAMVLVVLADRQIQFLESDPTDPAIITNKTTLLDAVPCLSTSTTCLVSANYLSSARTERRAFRPQDEATEVRNYDGM